jgi:hypothetical protein
MVRLATSRSPTCTPPSWSRYSMAPNQYASPFLSGPPSASAYCWRSNGGASCDSSSVAGCDCSASSRRNSEAVPWSASVPERVTTLIADAPERPLAAV